MKVATLMFADIESYHAALIKTVNLITVLSGYTDADRRAGGLRSIQHFIKGLQMSAENHRPNRVV